jgi:hypothetical protein
VACNLAARALGNPSGSQPVVALADSAGADITPMQCDEVHGTALAQQAGQAVGSGIVQAARQAVQNAGAFTVEIHYAELSPSLETPVVACLEKALPSRMVKIFKCAVALQWKRRFWYCPLIYCTGIVDA